VVEVHSFDTVSLEASVAHGGPGEIGAKRVIDRGSASGLLFVDLAVVPRGVCIGAHTHDLGDEELYIVVEGRGEMEVDGELVPVGPGSVVVNRPGGRHGLRNTGEVELRLVVVDVSASG
jgi:mannose-6-phosphate isomerase-like protein (cupin superfamily)